MRQEHQSVPALSFCSRGTFDSAPRFRPSPFLTGLVRARTHARIREGQTIAGFTIETPLDRGKWHEREKMKGKRARVKKKTACKAKNDVENGAGRRRRDERWKMAERGGDKRGGKASLVKFGIWHNQRPRPFPAGTPCSSLLTLRQARNRFASE